MSRSKLSQIPEGDANVSVAGDAAPQPPKPVNGADAAQESSVFLVPPSPSPVTQEFKLADFLVDAGPTETRVDTGIELVRARKPSPTKYVAVHPEKRYGWIVPEDRDSRRDAHLVTPAIGKTLMPLCRRARLVAWVDPDCNYGVWPILLEGSTGEINEYSLSAMAKVDMAITGGKWYCFRVPKGKRGYGLWEADSDLGTPVWPPEGIDLLIQKAFEDRAITTQDHPLLKALRGKPVR